MEYLGESRILNGHVLESSLLPVLVLTRKLPLNITGNFRDNREALSRKNGNSRGERSPETTVSRMFWKLPEHSRTFQKLLEPSRMF